MRPGVYITCLAATATIGLAVLVARSEPRADADDQISIARQLRLKRKLMMGSDSLLATMRANRRNWDTLTGEQRRRLHDRAYAFRQADPRKRDAVLDAWERFRQLDTARQQRYRKRAAWLHKLLGRLSEEQKAELRRLPSRERAKKLLELENQLSRPQPTTTSAGVSQPGTEPNHHP